MVDSPFRSDLNKEFDKGDLKDELKNAGLEDSVADDIADRVNDRKTDAWTQDMGRQEALREIEMFIDRTKAAYENYRNRNLSSSGAVSTSAY